MTLTELASARLDPRTPIIVGGGQVNAPEDERDPVLLLADAARLAGPQRILARIGSIRLARIVSRRYPDPGRLLAAEIGAEPAETIYSEHGGHMPQSLLAGAASDIFRGRADIVLVGGAEAWRARRRAKSSGRDLGWLSQSDAEQPTRTWGDPLVLGSPDEGAIGFGEPVQGYPLFEIALRHAAGLSPQAHLERVAALWADFSDVASTNPYAALGARLSEDDIVSPSAENRLIGYPYRKLMVSNADVNQAAALIMCSVGRARAMGVPSERWVFIHGLGTAMDTPDVSSRGSLAHSPAIAAAGEQALAAARIGVDEIEFVDLYSCFPSAVQIAARELGIRDGRRLTVTGGLTFAGGPWNNYVSHALATIVSRLRETPDAYALCTANGGLLTKHVAGVYSGRPGPFVDQTPRAFRPPCRPVDHHFAGSVRIESYTVMHDRAGNECAGYVSCLTPEGARALVRCDEPAVNRALKHADLCGATATIRGQRLLDVDIQP